MNSCEYLSFLLNIWQRLKVNGKDHFLYGPQINFIIEYKAASTFFSYTEVENTSEPSILLQIKQTHMQGSRWGQPDEVGLSGCFLPHNCTEEGQGERCHLGVVLQKRPHSQAKGSVLLAKEASSRNRPLSGGLRTKGE